MNSVNLIGRITKDPEIRLVNNNNVVGFTIAVDRDYKDQNGNKIADFISCVAWNNQADFIGRYVKKGNMLAVTGFIQTRSYQAQNGETKTVVEVIVNTVNNLTPREQTQPQPNQFNQYPNQQYQQPNQYQNQQRPNQNVKVNGQPTEFIVDDSDLPF